MAALRKVCDDAARQAIDIAQVVAYDDLDVALKHVENAKSNNKSIDEIEKLEENLEQMRIRADKTVRLSNYFNTNKAKISYEEMKKICQRCSDLIRETPKHEFDYTYNEPEVDANDPVTTEKLNKLSIQITLMKALQAHPESQTEQTKQPEQTK